MKTESVSRKARAWRASPTLLSVAILFPFLAILPLPRIGWAASCTRGVNCYCDRVKNVSSPIYDPNLVMCEDFEAPTLHDDVGFGNGAPTMAPGTTTRGPARTGGACIRGFEQLLSPTYGDPVGSCAWQNGAPLTPRLGYPCVPSGNNCYGGAWRPDDLWQANSFACISILRNGEFGAEDANILPPTNYLDRHAGRL